MSDTVLETASGKNSSTENFPVGSFLIRPDLRLHIHAFYKFARAADDISDHPTLSAQEKITRLEKFAATLLDDRNNDIPVAAALRRSLRHTGVSPQHSLDLLTAFKRDVTQLRYRDWYDLMDYCNFSAAPVGRHVLALHSVGERAWKANDALCNALQVINHIQDCADDYRELDRVYIPQDMLAGHGGHIEDLSGDRSSRGLLDTLHEMCAKLDPMLKEARELPKQIPDRRLSAETSVICALAENLVALLKKRDPLRDNMKPGKISVFCAATLGVLRAFL